MQLKKVKVKNFRLLADTELALADETTLVVGRNNSGKTSLSEVIRRFLSDGPASFQLEDFSSASYGGFCEALDAHNEGKEEAAIRALIPSIELRLHFRYEPEQPNLGPLSPFVIDLDPECSEAVVVIEYTLKDGGVKPFFEEQPKEALTAATKPSFFRTLRDRIPPSFVMKIWAEDPNDATNRRIMPPTALRHLVTTGFINAQRGLDDVTSRETDILAKVLEGLFSTASSDGAAASDRVIAEELKKAIKDIQLQMDNNFGGHLQKLMPTLKSFGYPGLGGQELQTETTLDVRRLLSNFTKVRYAGYEGVALPESYNGLGVRNLIFILLQLVGFHRAFRAEPASANVHLIFIEEPEAHLHPQMQELFIRQLSLLATQLSDGPEDGSRWPVQFVVSTHSSHIANAAGFASIRYFLSVNAPDTSQGVRQTRIRDLSQGLSGKSKADREFLHQYLTLTRCDLFFADKAVLVEGLSERLLLPVIVGKCEAAEPASPKLSTQYTTIMEVGGAYAHLFVELLEFLELRSLVITDLDAVEKPGGTACAVHLGSHSSNACLKSWIGTNELSKIVAKTYAERCKGRNRIAYQCPENIGDPCGRTFEDAFILANRAKFGISDADADALEIVARDLAGTFKKSDFALRYAIAETDWIAPRYLVEGVRWLAAEELPDVDPALAFAKEAAAAASAKIGEAPGV